jgi:hypothetical protein
LSNENESVMSRAIALAFLLIAAAAPARGADYRNV